MPISVSSMVVSRTPSRRLSSWERISSTRTLASEAPRAWARSRAAVRRVATTSLSGEPVVASMRQRYPAAALGVDATREAPRVGHPEVGGGSHTTDGLYADTESTAGMSVGSLDLPKHQDRRCSFLGPDDLESYERIPSTSGVTGRAYVAGVVGDSPSTVLRQRTTDDAGDWRRTVTMLNAIATVRAHGNARHSL